jgi:hypothetical protein
MELPSGQHVGTTDYTGKAVSFPRTPWCFSTLFGAQLAGRFAAFYMNGESRIAMQIRSSVRWSLGLFATLAVATAVRPVAAGYAVARTSVTRAPPRPVPVARGPVVVNRSVAVSTYNPAAAAVGVAAAAAVTAVAIGTIVNSLPPQCTTVVTAGVTYQHCGNDWYRPQYSGTDVTYVAVPPP